MKPLYGYKKNIKEEILNEDENGNSFLFLNLIIAKSLGNSELFFEKRKNIQIGKLLSCVKEIYLNFIKNEIGKCYNMNILKNDFELFILKSIESIKTFLEKNKIFEINILNMLYVIDFNYKNKEINDIKSKKYFEIQFNRISDLFQSIIEKPTHLIYFSDIFFKIINFIILNLYSKK